MDRRKDTKSDLYIIVFFLNVKTLIKNHLNRNRKNWLIILKKSNEKFQKKNIFAAFVLTNLNFLAIKIIFELNK